MTVTLISGFNPGVYTGTGNNTYLIAGREPTLIDAATGDPRHLAGVRAALGASSLGRVLVTHAHADHIGGAPALAADWPGAAFAKLPWPERDREHAVDWRALADGDRVPAGDGVLRAVHTPGHAPDHLCFHDESTGTLFCGDLLVRDGTVVIPGGRGGSLGDYLESLARIRALGPARVLPAHGPEIADVVELIDRTVEHRRRRDAEVLAALAPGAATREQIVERVYVGLRAELAPVAADSVLAHLLKLEAEARVRRHGEMWERT